MTLVTIRYPTMRSRPPWDVRTLHCRTLCPVCDRLATDAVTFTIQTRQAWQLVDPDTDCIAVVQDRGPQS